MEHHNFSLRGQFSSIEVPIVATLVCRLAKANQIGVAKELPFVDLRVRLNSFGCF